MSVCLSFDNLGSKDGIGAQVLRIIDVFSISKFTKVGFVNSRILSFDSNPGDNLPNLESKVKFLTDLEDYLDLDRFSCPKPHVSENLPNYRMFKFILIFKLWLMVKKFVNSLMGKHSMLILKNPYRFTSKIPRMRDHFLATRLGRIEDSSTRSAINIQMHIRRGFVSNSKAVDRFTATSWYISCLSPILTQLTELSVPYQITVHTDVHKENINWSAANVSKESLDYITSNGNDLHDDGTITLDLEDFSETLRELGPIKIVTEMNPVESWKLMEHADLLLIAKSTFSFVPAIINVNSVVISPIGFLAGPRNWIYLGESGLSSSRLVSEVLPLLGLSGSTSTLSNLSTLIRRKLMNTWGFLIKLTFGMR